MIKWSRRVSNPRPNDESLSFLHVYSLINCRYNLGQRHPITILSFLISRRIRSIINASLKLMVLLDPSLTGGSEGEGTCLCTIIPLD